MNVFETPAELAAAVADAVVEDAGTAIAQRGAFFIALAGGATPKAAYELLAQEPRSAAIDWTRVQVFFGDERCVPPGHPDSNYRMAREAFLSSCGIPDSNVHRMHGESEPPQAARDYAALLVDLMGESPRFDLVLLGMGPDGHTASLFPGEDPQTDAALLVRSVYVPAKQTHRITLTPAVINNARHVLVAVEGVTKAPALYAVLKGPRDPVEHPIQCIKPDGGRLSWFVDRAAAAEF
jgi:6-phosphogluconolactonase